MTDPVAAPGARLKAERERRNLSAEKAGNEMHLDAWVIEALEGEDYPRVGPEVYVKGHLKRYAQMLGLPVSEILEGYEKRERTVAPAPQAAPSSVRMATTPPPVNNVAWSQVAGLAAGALLLVGVLWWKPWHHRDGGTPSAAAAPAKPDAPASSVVDPPSLAADIPAAVLPVAPPVQKAGTPAVQAAAAPAVSPAPDGDASLGAGHARLRLSFSADSWVDVHDAEGHRAYAGNGRANSVKTIAGTAPMRVYLGFASGVQLEINNRAVAIGRQFMAGDVARFEAGADGVLRRDAHAAAAPSAQNRNARPPG